MDGTKLHSVRAAEYDFRFGSIQSTITFIIIASLGREKSPTTATIISEEKNQAAGRTSRGNQASNVTTFNNSSDFCTTAPNLSAFPKGAEALYLVHNERGPK